MPNTTNLALPYPSNTDYVAQGYAQIQNLATGVDAFYGAWTTFTQASTGFSFNNVTSGSCSGAYRILGKIVYCHLAITAGTATAAGTVGITLPSAMPSTIAGQVYPIPCLLSVGGLQSTTVSARLENGTRGITFYASTGGGSFALNQVCTLSTNFAYEAA